MENKTGKGRRRKGNLFSSHQKQHVPPSSHINAGSITNNGSEHMSKLDGNNSFGGETTTTTTKTHAAATAALATEEEEEHEATTAQHWYCEYCDCYVPFFDVNNHSASLRHHYETSIPHLERVEEWQRNVMGPLLEGFNAKMIAMTRGEDQNHCTGKDKTRKNERAMTGWQENDNDERQQKHFAHTHSNFFLTLNGRPLPPPVVEGVASITKEEGKGREGDERKENDAEEKTPNNIVCARQKRQRSPPHNPPLPRLPYPSVVTKQDFKTLSNRFSQIKYSYSIATEKCVMQHDHTDDDDGGCKKHGMRPTQPQRTEKNGDDTHFGEVRPAAEEEGKGQLDERRGDDDDRHQSVYTFRQKLRFFSVTSPSQNSSKEEAKREGVQADNGTYPLPGILPPLLHTFSSHSHLVEPPPPPYQPPPPYPIPKGEPQNTAKASHSLQSSPHSPFHCVTSVGGISAATLRPPLSIFEAERDAKFEESEGRTTRCENCGHVRRHRCGRSQRKLFSTHA